MTDTFECFRTQPALAENYRLVTYSRRGFAGSAKHSGPCPISQQAADAGAAVAFLEAVGDQTGDPPRRRNIPTGVSVG